MSHHFISTLTLLLSRKELPKSWQNTLFQRLPQLDQVHLFLLEQATYLLGEDFSQLPAGKRVFCAHSHRLLQAPPPAKNSIFAAGGLANLGEMVRLSHGTLSLPNSHWPRQRDEPSVKNIGILLAQEPERLKEGIRLAAGLAGCNHEVTLYSPSINHAEVRKRFPEITPLLEALHTMKVPFNTSIPLSANENHSVLLQL